jgi:hypothetical protein
LTTPLATPKVVAKKVFSLTVVDGISSKRDSQN